MHNFFNYINPEKTFTELRREARLDHELLGNSAFEVVRSKDGKPALLTHVPFVTVRILPLDEQRVEIEMDRKTDAVTLGKLKIHKRFRSFVQIQESVAVFFKEFGDPRLRSAKTGMIYKDLETMKRAEPEAVPATEIWHRRIPAPNEAYGMPRWIGTLLAVFGTRLSEEVNFMYFDNKSVPPLAILVSGGRIAADSVSKIEAFVENRIKGERNFHRILILEAEAAADGEAKNNGRVQIKLVPLTDAQQSDALFQRYDARNADKVGASFRLPPILRGEARDLNRSTAEVAKALAEEQVFQPERDAFDADVNRRLLPQLGIRFWEFRTRAAGTRDPQTVSTMLAQLAAAGIVMPDEARDIAADVFGRKFEHRTEDFFRQPLRLSIASVRSKKEIPEIDRERHPSAGAIEGEQKGGDGEPTDAEYTAAARRIARLRAEVDAVQLGEEVVKVPRREFESWLAQPGATPNGK
jgi:PBSX family phage portal protein